MRRDETAGQGRADVRDISNGLVNKDLGLKLRRLEVHGRDVTLTRRHRQMPSNHQKRINTKDQLHISLPLHLTSDGTTSKTRNSPSLLTPSSNNSSAVQLQIEPLRSRRQPSSVLNLRLSDLVRPFQSRCSLHESR